MVGRPRRERASALGKLKEGGEGGADHDNQQTLVRKVGEKIICGKKGFSKTLLPSLQYSECFCSERKYRFQVEKESFMITQLIVSISLSTEGSKTTHGNQGTKD